MKQYITRNGSFDSCHRVMNETMKCFSIHGHTYLYELTFVFDDMQSIGYAIDFKEIKRVACQWIDDMLDHGAILNPADGMLISVAKALKSKYWCMSLQGSEQYCNPTVENIAKEIFLAMSLLFVRYPTLDIYKVKLYETPNCSTECLGVSDVETREWMETRRDVVIAYAEAKGMLEYDDRKLKP